MSDNDPGYRIEGFGYTSWSKECEHLRERNAELLGLLRELEHEIRLYSSDSWNELDGIMARVRKAIGEEK